MLLSELGTRVRRWMRDLSQQSIDLTTEIGPTLQDFISENYMVLVKSQPRFYLTQETYTGVVDGEGDDSSEFELPEDFWYVGNIRRSDLADKPKLKYVGDHLDIDRYKYSLHYKFYDPDPAVPIQSVEAWTLFNATHFRILPAPASSSYTYEFNYYRKWVEAVQGSDEVDVPDRAIPFVTAGVAHDLLLTSNDPTADRVRSRLMEIMSKFKSDDERVRKGVLPEAERWW